MDLGIGDRRAIVCASSKGLGRICAFLCSAHAGYITGQNILVDGGLYPGAF
jgi:3-oxoacyl-[acyl-carrier protein] reductase